MEERGYVGPFEGSKPRQLLINHRGEDTAADILRLNAVHPQEAVEHGRVFVGTAPGLDGDLCPHEERLSVKDPQRDVGVADVHCQEHSRRLRAGAALLQETAALLPSIELTGRSEECLGRTSAGAMRSGPEGR